MRTVRYRRFRLPDFCLINIACKRPSSISRVMVSDDTRQRAATSFLEYHFSLESIREPRIEFLFPCGKIVRKRRRPTQWAFAWITPTQKGRGGTIICLICLFLRVPVRIRERYSKRSRRQRGNTCVLFELHGLSSVRSIDGPSSNGASLLMESGLLRVTSGALPQG